MEKKSWSAEDLIPNSFSQLNEKDIGKDDFFGRRHKKTDKDDVPPVALGEKQTGAEEAKTGNTSRKN